MNKNRPHEENGDRSPVLDPACVATMHRLNLVERLYPAFTAELPERLAALRAAVAAADRSGVRQLTHRLRGSAAQLGATALARALYVIEEAALDESSEVLEAASLGLDDLVRTTISALLNEVERVAR